MPEIKPLLSRMIIDKQQSRGITDREISEELDEQQQTFNTWKRGSLPRMPRPKLATFLGVTEERLQEIVDESRETSAATKLPAFTTYARVSTYGRIADRKEGRFKFDTTRKAVPEGRYAVVVDTKVMEPALHVGSKVWLDPGIWPKPGNEVIAHAGGQGWIGVLDKLEAGHATLTRYGADPVVVKDVDAVHVIVLSERV